MTILVINCGSSSIKYQLLDMKSRDDYELIAKGLVEKISLPGGVSDHKEGMKLILNKLEGKKIDAVGHRIVQGASYFKGSVLINDDVLKKIGICSEFAPLHNPAHLLGIEAVSQVLPDVPQVAVFDTAFHQTMEPVAYMYALPYKYYEKYGIRRYGAHGTSHQYVSSEGAAFAGVDLKNSKIITCHIGNGSSVTAVRNGKCVDTSMGFTPLEGMIMGTRCGCIDASIVPYVMKKENLTPDQMTDVLNKKSGFLGLSEKSSDCRDMEALAKEGDAKARLVLDKLAFDIIKLVGSYVAEMGGVDLIVFTAGIAENNAWLREKVANAFSFMGVKIDSAVNATAKGKPTLISTPDSTAKVLLFPTNEELVIARDTMNIVLNNK